MTTAIWAVTAMWIGWGVWYAMAWPTDADDRSE